MDQPAKGSPKPSPHPTRSRWENLAAVATTLGLFVAAGGLFFSGLQLRSANEQSQQSAAATELQAFSELNQQINNPTQIMRFTTAVSHLGASFLSTPRERSTFTAADEDSIISLSGQYDQMAKLLLLDKSALPHAQQLFAAEMTCASDDRQTLKRVIRGLYLAPVKWLSTFTHNATCPASVTVGGITLGFPSGVPAR